MIEDYHFGKIKIDGKPYDYDISLDWQGNVLPWQRKESHLFRLEEIKEKIESLRPEIVILGTGAYGMAKVSSEAKEYLESSQTKFSIEKTGKGVRIFNEKLKEGKKVLAFFHLTC